MNKILAAIFILVALAAVLLVGIKLSFVKNTAKPTPAPSPAANFSDSCRTDSDCALVNKKYALSCCYDGACEAIDYASQEWVAVNSSDFAKQKEQKCGLQDKGSQIERCGPQPLCATRAINDNFTASCIDNICQKIATQNDCASDSDCGQDQLCFSVPPRGPAKGIPGSASNPGKCWDKQTINQSF